MKKVLTGLVLIGLLSTVGQARSPRTTFSDLFIEVETRLRELDEPTTKAERREARLLRKVLRRGERDSKNLRKDLLHARALAKAVTKRFDDRPNFQSAMQYCYARLRRDVQERIEELRQLEQMAAARKATLGTASKHLNNAQTLVQQASAAPGYTGLTPLIRGVGKATKAAKILGQLLPAGAQAPGPQPLVFVTGRNDFQIDVDGDKRSFIVEVPATYDPAIPTPVVCCFPGTGQSPNDIYQKWNWDQQAQQNGWLAVFPASKLMNLTTKPGVPTYKWNVVGLHQIVANPATLPDDVRFVKRFLGLMEATFNVDTKRIYGTGFSNGENMMYTRLVPEMSDVFAAFAGAGATDNNPYPANAVPAPSYYRVVGTIDNKVLSSAGYQGAFPMDHAMIAQEPHFNTLFTSLGASLGIDSSTYTPTLDPPWFTTMTFDTSVGGGPNEFRFRMVNNMDHIYPQGSPHGSGLELSVLFTDFFNANPKP